MKSSVSTSTIDERMIRKYWPSSIRVIAVAGQDQVLGDVERLGEPARELDPGGHLLAGREGSGIQTAKTRIRMIPIQYSGAE